MGWNIEVACVRSADLDRAVPDVLAPTGRELHFEDATSVLRAPDMCAALWGDWSVVIDVGCRLSGSEPYLTEASETELHLIRVADEPRALHYRDGRRVSATLGRAACLAIAPREDGDGELCAMDILEQRIGLSVHRDLWSVRFMLFTVPM